jgi:hypothetical protein
MTNPINAALACSPCLDACAVGCASGVADFGAISRAAEMVALACGIGNCTCEGATAATVRIAARDGARPALHFRASRVPPRLQRLPHRLLVRPPDQHVSAHRMPRPRALTEFLLRHPVLAFVAMGAAFILFGITSLDLYRLLAANIRLFIDYGLAVIDDGALQQLAELTGLSALAALFYLLFALCEKTLVRRLLATWMRERAE